MSWYVIHVFVTVIICVHLVRYTKYKLSLIEANIREKDLALLILFWNMI